MGVEVGNSGDAEVVFPAGTVVGIWSSICDHKIFHVDSPSCNAQSIPVNFSSTEESIEPGGLQRK